MGPASLRLAGIAEVVASYDYQVVDLGDADSQYKELVGDEISHPNGAIRNLTETKAWIETLRPKAYAAIREHDLAIFLGGDHSLAAGTVPGVTQFAEEIGRPQYVLWLDAHPDLHTLESTETGNLHGTPVAYFTGQDGTDALPTLKHKIEHKHICMMGIRSVDTAERSRISRLGIDVQDMRSIDEHGVLKPLNAFLERVRANNGMLHLSFDVDFLDPEIAPAVGTAVSGGITYREAHLIMETLCDSELVTSIDIAELNPFLDVRGRTATLMVELMASLLGRRIINI
jgi:arginase